MAMVRLFLYSRGHERVRTISPAETLARSNGTGTHEPVSRRAQRPESVESPGVLTAIVRSVTTTDSAGVTARVRLADYAPTRAELRIVGRTRFARMMRASLVAIGVPPVALVAFLIPPHGETLFLAVGVGAYLVYREATTRYVVHSFDGTCPRCGNVLRLKRGSRLTSARSVPCYGCHFHPTIEITGRVE